MLSYKRSSIFAIVMARSVVVLLLTCGLGHQARAVDLTFTAEFRPNAANPTHNKFVNTTPQSGYCEHWPHLCGDRGFGVAVPIEITFENMDVNGADRNSAYFQLPTRYRDIRVINSADGSDAAVRWRANVMSLRIDNWGASGASPAFGGNWGTYPPAPCAYLGAGIGNGTYYEFGWRLPENIGPCVKTPLIEMLLPMRTSRFSVGYELITPDPLAMKNGIYRGDLTLTVGPSGDFDFGDRATVSDSVVNVHFELTVQHELRVEFPPGSDRMVLVPEGGWNSWVDHGRLPTRLSRDLPFSLSSSAPFSITLQCQYPQSGGDCGLRDITTQAAPEVPVQVAVTMPGFREARRNVDALNLKLSTQGAVAHFTSDTYAANRASRLHFDVTGENVKSILDHPGSQYRGNVTVVFDAQP